MEDRLMQFSSARSSAGPRNMTALITAPLCEGDVCTNTVFSELLPLIDSAFTENLGGSSGGPAPSRDSHHKFNKPTGVCLEKQF